MLVTFDGSAARFEGELVGELDCRVPPRLGGSGIGLCQVERVPDERLFHLIAEREEAVPKSDLVRAPLLEGGDRIVVAFEHIEQALDVVVALEDTGAGKGLGDDTGVPIRQAGPRWYAGMRAL